MRGMEVRATLALAAALVAAGCASTGATFGSGVGDAYLERPPYYAGPRPAADAGLQVGHLPVAYQAGASQAPIFDPAATGPVQGLLADMNAYLDSLGVTVRLVAAGGRPAAVAGAVPPDVQFGCDPGPGGFEDECADLDDEALGRGDPSMRLAVGRPSPEWVAWAADLMGQSGADAALVVTLEIGQYTLRQEGIRGSKVVLLGTDHVGRFPWLTSLETPVAVLQLTGALVGPDGKAIRIGAEGLYARRTPFLASVVGAQALVSDEDMEQLRTARRDDLPGEPLVWREGLRRLVEQLLGEGAGG